MLLLTSLILGASATWTRFWRWDGGALGGQVDPNTTSYSSWWYDSAGSIRCLDMPTYWGITVADFLWWVSRYRFN